MSRFSQRFFAASPEPGHLMSRMILARASTGATSIDPEVSMRTSKPSSQRRRISSNDSLCASGSPAGDLDEVAAVALDARDDVVELHPLAAGERVLGVAPAAAQVAAGEADEDARPPGVRRLALDGMEDLSDAHTTWDRERPPPRIPSAAGGTSRSARTPARPRRGRSTSA